MNTFRYKPPSDWSEGKSNQRFLGFCTMLSYIDNFFKSRNDLKMIEIGAYMGESTSLFSSTGMFSEIHCIEPFDHDQDCLDILGHKDWDFVNEQFKINTRLFDNIKLYQDFSYNVSDIFDNNSFDFVYIDGSHDYEAVINDIENYKKKLKGNSLIGGHDIDYNGVKEAVKEVFGEADETFSDFSWIKINNDKE